MKKYANIQHGNLWLSAGWFRNNPFKVVEITLGEAVEEYQSKKIGQIVFINFQFLRFVFSIGWSA